MEDREIVDLYLQRNSSAIDESNIKYGSTLHNTAYRILSSHEDSDECVNDTYYSAWKSIPPTVSRSLGAYLVSIIRNISISRIRERCADKRGKGEYNLVYEELTDIISAQNKPDAEIEIKELSMVINRFLDTLKADDRKIFVRRYWLMESVKQIAVKYGMTESRVKSSLFRSRSRLKKQLEEEGYL